MSLTIFTMNARELERIFLIIEANKYKLNSTEDGELRKQIRRGVNYLLHNFVAAARTLVDHTRVFISENYQATVLQEKYQAKIAADIKSNKNCLFIHDLRNYMLHCGPPALSIRTSITSGNRVDAGVHFISSSLLEWNGWKSLSKEYIKERANWIDIDDIARTYSNTVVSLHSWLDLLLSEHHESDLQELRALQDQARFLTNNRMEADEEDWHDWQEPKSLSGLPWIHNA